MKKWVGQLCSPKVHQNHFSHPQLLAPTKQLNSQRHSPAKQEKTFPKQEVQWASAQVCSHIAPLERRSCVALGKPLQPHEPSVFSPGEEKY